MNRNIIELKKEISDVNKIKKIHKNIQMKENYIEKVKETKNIMNSLCEDQENVHLIKEEIKKINKMNSDVNVNIFIFF